MNKLYLIAVIIVSFSVFNLSCVKKSLRTCVEHETATCEKNDNKTNIRIKNISSYDFCNVKVTPPGGDINYGIIKSGKKTCYTFLDVAYRYAPVELFIGDDQFTFIIIDYVGEPELGIGDFTYEIDVTDFGGKVLSIASVKD